MANRIVFACGLTAVLLAGCADPAAEEARKAQEEDRFQLLTAALVVHSCEQKPVVTAGECSHYREVYRHMRAAFIAKYGNGEE